MTEGPWSNPTPRTAEAPAAGKPPNWGFFLLINLGIGLAVGVANELLTMAVGFGIPDIVINLAVLYVTVSWAGNRWLKANGRRWERSDRHRLAFAYTMVNAVITLIAFAIFAVLITQGMGADLGLPPEATDPSMWPMLGGIMAIVLPLALWANYGLNRLVLFHVVNKNATGPDDISKEFA